MLLPLLAVAWAADDDDAWDVNAPHGDVHEVSLDLDEGTWMSVSVHHGVVLFDLLGDVWSVPVGGGIATRLTEGPAWEGQPVWSLDGERIAFVSDRGGNENIWTMNADGTSAEAFTKEEVARCTDPVWDPTGPYLLYRRRTVDTRSIGVTEIWQKHLEGGDGFALTSKDDHPHAGEPFVQGPYVYFSSRQGRFEYDADPVAGLWEVQRLDRRTGDLRPIAHGPGSASRPVLSPDGSRLYFVSRERDRTLLEALDLASGRRATLADWLSPDELEGFSLHGTYPTIDVTPDGDLVFWARGKLYRLDPVLRTHTEIRFRAAGSWTLHDVTRWPLPIEDTLPVRVIRWPTLSVRDALAYSAVGALWVRTPDGQHTRISEGTGYAPAWSPDGTSLAWTSFSDREGGALHVTGPDGLSETLPIEGQLTNPAWSSDDALVVLRSPGGSVSRDLGDVAWHEIVVLEREKPKKPWSARVVTTIDAQWGPRRTRLALHEGRVWFAEYRAEEPREPSVAVLVSVALDGTDKRDHLRLGAAEEVVISPDFSRVAYKLDHQLWVTALPPFAHELEVSALPTRKVTPIVGDWLAFTPDSAEVTWVEGPTFKRVAVAGLWEDEDDDEDEKEDEEEEEDDAEAFLDAEGVVAMEVGLTLPRARPEGTLVLANVDVITMRDDEVLRGVNVVIERDRIVEIGPGATRVEATVLDLTGKTVMPGLVDVHAHLHFSSGDILPEQEWRYLVALDYGVTTVHDPSTLSDLVFTQQQAVDAGFMRGPRIWSTGAVLYGAAASDAAETPDLDAARAHVRRMALLGANSVKVYQQSQRERRQWYVQACNELQLLCVPEGGGDLWQDLGMVVDGFHAIEHALPTAPLYRDVLSLMAASADSGDGWGTFYTPTLQVAYGGLGGQNWFLQHEDPVDDPRLRRHTPARMLEAALWRHEVMAQDQDWRFHQVARDAAALTELGGHVTLGAHGELQGLGVHWELRALGGPEAMAPHAALRAATLEGARYLGLEHQIGSVEVGKLADLLVLDADPLADLRNASKIYLVLKNGERAD